MVPQVPRPRLPALDLFRGATVAGMIIVNTPGSADHLWWPLDHAAWNGFTPTDLVFPAFLFAVGFALALSFPRPVDAQGWRRIARRVASLIAIGWAWQMLARPALADFRLFGVLQRIGLCYGIVATVAPRTARRDPAGRRHLRWRVLAFASLAVLMGYAALMLLVPVPGFGAGVLTPEGNLAGFVDRAVVGTAHLWQLGTDAAGNRVYDPEGLLSTIPALANVLIGMLAAIVWQRLPVRAAAWIALGGVALVVTGLAIDPWFPVNKRLWTSSCALLCSGLSALLIAACMALGTGIAESRPLAPFFILGRNAILGYVVSLLIGLAGMRLVVGGESLQAQAFAGVASLVSVPDLASFLYALGVLLVVIALLAPLDRRGIHLRL